MGVATVTGLVWALLPLLMFIYPQVDAIRLQPVGSWLIAISCLTLAVVSGAAIWFSLGKLEQRFYYGRSVPPRNLPEKVTSKQ